MVMAALVKEKEPTHEENLLRWVIALPKFRTDFPCGGFDHVDDFPEELVMVW